jgi:Ca-activated chloride channel homolog
MQQLTVAIVLALAVIAESHPLTLARGALSEVEGQGTPRTPRASDKRTRDIYVSVVDGNGKAVTGLTAEDFTVREDGVAREVTSAGPATDQLTISLLVDDSQSASEAVQFMRDALPSFVQRLSGKAEIAVATVGERPTNQIDYTTSTDALKKVLGRLFQKTGSGAYLLDGIIEVSRGLQKREAKRPHIVAISTEGPEFSNRSHQQVLDALYASGASLHVLALGQPSDSQADEMRERNIVIGEGPAKTGGRRDQVLALSGLTDRVNQVADELTNQYVVQYGRPDQLIPPEKVQVTVKRQGLTVRARTRATDK